MKSIQDPEKLKKVGEFYDQVAKANKDYLDFWKEHTLFHWDFWLTLLLFIILPVLFWVKIRKKDSSNRLLFVGFFVIIITSWFDFLGVQFGLWYYTGKVIPSIPSYIPWDFVIFPVFIMSLIQIKPSLSPYIKGLLFAVVSAFVGEPIFLWLGFYVMDGWHTYYSFPIYFFIYLLAHKMSTVENFAPIK
ncbi:MAG TPA: CBO0543 family protein [Pseudoneobacillus sp.]|nr:CBO0543 family protein [Pseudoneobacillus sp.]